MRRAFSCIGGIELHSRSSSYSTRGRVLSRAFTPARVWLQCARGAVDEMRGSWRRDPVAPYSNENEERDGHLSRNRMREAWSGEHRSLHAASRRPLVTRRVPRRESFSSLTPSAASPLATGCLCSLSLSLSLLAFLQRLPSRLASHAPRIHGFAPLRYERHRRHTHRSTERLSSREREFTRELQSADCSVARRVDSGSERCGGSLACTQSHTCARVCSASIRMHCDAPIATTRSRVESSASAMS